MHADIYFYCVCYLLTLLCSFFPLPYSSQDTGLVPQGSYHSHLTCMYWIFCLLSIYIHCLPHWIPNFYCTPGSFNPCPTMPPPTYLCLLPSAPSLTYLDSYSLPLLGSIVAGLLCILCILSVVMPCTVCDSWIPCVPPNCPMPTPSPYPPTCACLHSHLPSAYTHIIYHVTWWWTVLPLPFPCPFELFLVSHHTYICGLVAFATFAFTHTTCLPSIVPLDHPLPL